MATRMISRCALLSALTVGFAPPCATAQSADERAFRDWLAREWERAAEFPDVGHNAITYRVEWYQEISDDELAKLKAEVEGHPDHPKRLIVEQAERRRRDGPDVERHTVWAVAADQWRQSRDHADGRYWDIAVSADAAWSLTANQLNIVDSGTEPPEGYDYASHATEISRNVGTLLYGGLQLLRHRDPSLSETALSDITWNAEATTDSGDAIRYSGVWIPADRRGEVREARVVACRDNPVFVGHRWEFRDWQLSTELGAWVAGRVDEYRPDGLLVRAVVFVSAVPFSDAEFQRLVSVPALNTPDPVRGSLTVRSVYDLRAGIGQETYLTETGPKVRAVQSPPADQQWTRLQTAGWALFGCLAAGLVVLRVLRRPGSPFLGGLRRAARGTSRRQEP